MAPWPSGKARVCKTLIPGPIPGGASKISHLRAGVKLADLAHLVERRLAKAKVAGSSPVIRSIRPGSSVG